MTGSISADELGIVLPHEHILFDVTVWQTMPEEVTKRYLAESPVSITILGELRRNPFINRDNLMQNNIELAVEELLYYKRAGGKSIVDLTTIGLGRDPLALRAISLQTGLNIIAGCGLYIDPAHPQRTKSMSTDQIAEEMIRDLTQGIGDTQVKAGVIGEIGTSWPITPNEEKSLKATARAYHKTKAPINIHPPLYNVPQGAPKVLDILEDEGVDLSKVALSHIDEMGTPMFDMEYQKSLAKRGVYISYDTFGSEVYFDSLGARDPCDMERVEGLVEMVKSGHTSQMLLSQDIWLKIYLRRYGGYGYDHLLSHIMPMLRRKGISEDQINKMIVENPKRYLAI